MGTVTITMSVEQYDEIIKGMEFYNRFIIGQPDSGHSPLWGKLCNSTDNPPFNEYEKWKYDTHRLFFPELHMNASYGWNKEPISYEIWREMRYQEQLHLGDTYGVYASEGLFSGKYPRLQIKFN